MPDFRGFECRFSLEPIRIILADSYGDDRRGAGLYYRIYKECFMNKKIRFAVIGCGHIGKRHAEMITRDEGAELVALCDIRPKEELGIEAYAVPFARNIDELFRLDWI